MPSLTNPFNIQYDVDVKVKVVRQSTEAFEGISLSPGASSLYYCVIFVHLHEFVDYIFIRPNLCLMIMIDLNIKHLGIKLESVGISYYGYFAFCFRTYSSPYTNQYL